MSWGWRKIKNRSTIMKTKDKYLFSIFLMCMTLSVAAKDDYGSDSIPRYTIGGSIGWANMLGRVDAGTNLVKNGSTQFYSIFLNSQSLPCDSNIYDRAWSFPSIEAGLLIADFSHVSLSRDYPTEHYMSGMGYGIGVYASFRRNIVSNRHLKLGYSLNNGIAYNTRPYNRYSNVDNEFIGSHLSLYFGFDLYGMYRFKSGIETGIELEFQHFSNSALDRPNKGANCIGVSAKVSVPIDNRYMNCEDDDLTTNSVSRSGMEKNIDRGFYIDTNILWGGKSLIDEWLYYYYSAPKDDPDYQTSHFRIRSVWGVSVAPMWRYSTKFASGIGLDYNYVTYADRIHEVDCMRGINGFSTNSHVLGISLRHEAFYKQLSAAMSIGYYLHRKMGYMAIADEKPYYETIGIHWYPSFLHGKGYIGYDVKAHLMKADCMEIRLGFHLF